MAGIEIVSTVSSAATFALLVGFAARYSVDWSSSVNAAREEMLALINEAQNTRHALNPIEEYAKADYVSEDERVLLLHSVGRLRSLNARLNHEMLSQLDNRNLSFYSKATWWFRRDRLREIAANVSAQKETLVAVQVSMLTKQVALLNRKVDMYEARETEGLESNAVRVSNESIAETMEEVMNRNVAGEQV